MIIEGDGKNNEESLRNVCIVLPQSQFIEINSLYKNRNDYFPETF